MITKKMRLLVSVVVPHKSIYLKTNQVDVKK